jgi:ribonuclease P/MRP protein subunit POP7
VYVKAAGKAIPRVLSVGNHFQGQVDCEVQVEMGTVCAIDDIEVLPSEAGGKGEGDGDEDISMMHVGQDGQGGEQKENGEVEKTAGKMTKKGRNVIPEEDVPETRIRTLSAVTVSIWLKSD